MISCIDAIFAYPIDPQFGIIFKACVLVFCASTGWSEGSHSASIVVAFSEGGTFKKICICECSLQELHVWFLCCRAHTKISCGPCAGVDGGAETRLKVKFVIFGDLEDVATATSRSCIFRLQPLTPPPPHLSLPESCSSLHTQTWRPRPPSSSSLV